MPIDNVNGGLLVAIQLILPCAPYLLYSISHFSQRRINAVKLLVLRSLDLWHQRFDDPLEKGNVRSQLATETHFVPDCCSALSCYPELLQFPEASLKSPKPFRCKPQAFQCFLIGGSEPPNYWTPWQAENVSPWKVPYLFCPYYIMIGWDAGAVSVVFPFNTGCCACLRDTGQSLNPTSSWTVFLDELLPFSNLVFCDLDSQILTHYLLLFSWDSVLGINAQTSCQFISTCLKY